ncbi:DUF3857 domain-containing transglutaminase family protein [bacterium]|nr:DUF3857 domain-containing transglutaminase family protein [bacterium]
MIQDRDKDFITSDEEKRKLIDAAGTEKDHKGADIVVVYDHTWGDVERSGLGNLSNNRMIKILTEKGVAENSVLRFDYDPRSYINNVKRLRIHRQGGGVEELDVSVYHDVSQPESMLYWRVKMKLYSLPHLQVGDALEWETFKKGFNVAYLDSGKGKNEASGSIDPDTWVDPETGIKPPMYGAFFDIVYFREKVPIKEKRYTLLSPKDMPLSYEFYNGECRSYCLVDDSYYTYSWEKKDIEGYKPEARMPGEQTAKPKLLVSSIHDWKEKSRWFYRVNETQFEWNDEIKQLVDKVTAPFKTDDEKVNALLHWSAQEIRYIGFSICQGEGYTLHPGIMTYDERGGVCKDYAGVLITLLRAAGYEAYAAQTQALEPVHRIPADQFNHCVTAWRKPDGTWKMLDPTWAPFSMDVWDSAETEQNYLIGAPEGVDLGVTREFTPEDSLMKITASSKIEADGKVSGQIDFWGKGRSDSSHRFIKAWAPAVIVDRAYQSMLAEIDPAIRVLKVENSDVNDLLKNYQNHLEYQVDEYALKTGQTYRLRIPMSRFIMAPTIARYLTMAEEDERKFDLFVVFRQLVEVEEDIILPKGYTLISKPVELDLSNEVAEFSARLTPAERGLKFQARFAIKVRRVKTSQYKAYKELTEKARELAERWFIIQKTDASNCG